MPPVDLTQAHILAQARLRRATVAAVGKAWDDLPGYDEANVPQFLATATAVVGASQRQASLLTNAFLARRLGRAPLPLNVAAFVGAATRNGVTPAEVYRRPFVTVWTALKSGTAWEVAVRAGLAHARSSAATDVQLAMRQTLVGVGQADSRIVGYERVPDGGACEYCLSAGGQRYRTDQLMPLHDGCGCGVDPITADFTPSLDLPVVDGVQPAIEQHGELGPVLVDSAHHFSQP